MEFIGTLALIAVGYVLLDQFLEAPLGFLFHWGSIIAGMALVIVLAFNGFAWVLPAVIATSVVALTVDFNRWIK